MLLHNYDQKAGFTLAETLITLGIIGVVAAITMPTLINKIQDRQNIAKWKREYSLINNAFQAILNDGIPISANYNPYGEGRDFSEEFVNAMAGKLSLLDCYMPPNTYNVPSCRTSAAPYHGIKLDWTGIGDTHSGYIALGGKKLQKGQISDSVNAYNFKRGAFLLNDGAVIYFGDSWGGPLMVVDVNNFTKGPNEIGRDVFIIRVSTNTRTNQHWMKPTGADGTPNWNNPESGSSGCSKDIGLQQTNTVCDAAGAGCSAYYLYGK